MTSVVRLFPLSTVRNIPIFLGTCAQKTSTDYEIEVYCVGILNNYRIMTLTAYGSDPSLSGNTSVFPWQTRSTYTTRTVYYSMAVYTAEYGLADFSNQLCSHTYWLITKNNCII